MRRREFLSTAVTLTALPLDSSAQPRNPLDVSQTLGTLAKGTGPAPIPGATWYTASTEGDGIVYRFAPGALAKAKYITADLLVDGNTLVVFNILLQEGAEGRTFRYAFGGLNQCSFRVRMALEMVNQNRWMADREGAFLKPMAGGDRVDLDRVDRLTLLVRRKGPQPAKWAMTPLTASPDEVFKLARPVLPKGPLLDEFGQSAQRDWPTKTRSLDALRERIRNQYDGAGSRQWPARFSRWGGSKTRKLGEGTGFFRTHYDGRRWWLADPDGYAFWSAGLDCVRVDTDARYDGIKQALAWMPEANAGVYRDVRGEGRTVNYLAANVIRALGPEGWRDKWAAIALAEMKRLRFNTVGNWSEWEFARKASFPYVRPMQFEGERCGMVYRDFPDVFHPAFDRDAADYASQLSHTSSDPAFIGYFLMNEPTWGFSSETPAAGMLYSAETSPTRVELARFLKTKYADDTSLGAAWGGTVTFARIERAKWSGILSRTAQDDLRDFSVRMVERYFTVLSKACKQVDNHHLNLGMRWAGVPPKWAVEGMKSFDVFSLNCYQDNLPLATAEAIHSLLKMPVMVGEWHFGALDVGLPASGIGHLKNQADRARAYRNYLEDAAADPYCVGAHWFTLYDESALGRSDGENYNIGFLDVANRPYDEMGEAAIASHERMYEVAAGLLPPYHQRLEYLPKLFL